MSTDHAYRVSGRGLHLASTPADFAEACRHIEAFRGPGQPAHWILSTDRPDADAILPPEVEWIRLPAAISAGPERAGGLSPDWLRALSGLVEALEPEIIIVHEDFARRSGGDHATICRQLPPEVRVVERHRSDRVNRDAEPRPRVGYVLKKFPRYSETFILREVLALEALGVPVQIFSLHLPWDGRFHASLANLRHSVEYVSEDTTKAFMAALPLVPAEPDSRAAFNSFLWECVDRGDPRLPGRLAQAVQVARRAREMGLTHLHAHFATSASEVARMAARLAGIGFSFTAHAKDIYADTVDRHGLALKFRDCRFAVTVCDANQRFLDERHPESREKVRVLYNGINLDRDEPDDSAGKGGNGADEPAAADHLPTVLAVGRFVEKKGFDRLLHALALLRQRGVRFRGRIVGDGELLDRMRALNAELGLEDIVEIPGSASSEQVRAEMRAATLLVCPSIVAADGDQDALPTVLLEAMSQRLPCVATPVGGIKEILDDGRAGMIVDDTVTAIANGVERLVGSPGLRSEYVERATTRVRECFDIHRNVRTLSRWFTESSPPAMTEAKVTEVGVV